MNIEARHKGGLNALRVNNRPADAIVPWAMLLPKLATLVPLCCSMATMGQWALGPRADLALSGSSPRYITYGIGASATYGGQRRHQWAADAFYYIPHVDHFIRVQGPRNLATGDTTSSTWRSNAHHSQVTLLLGLQCTFNHRPKPMEWYWKIASGIVRDLNRTEGEVTYKYSGEQRPFEYASHSTYAPLQFGAGRVWHVKHADLALELSGIIPCYSLTDDDIGPKPREFAMCLTFNYRWRI